MGRGFAEYETTTMKCQLKGLYKCNHKGLIFAESRLLILEL